MVNSKILGMIVVIGFIVLMVSLYSTGKLTPGTTCPTCHETNCGVDCPCDCSQCQNELEESQASHNTCIGDLTSCQGERNQCVNDRLPKCQLDYTNSSNELTTCQGNLITRGTELTSCQGERNQCVNVNLPKCQLDYTTRGTELTTCQGNLNTRGTELTDCQLSGQQIANNDYTQVGRGYGYPGYRLGGHTSTPALPLTLDQCVNTCTNNGNQCFGINYLPEDVEQPCRLFTEKPTVKFLPDSKYISYVKRKKDTSGNYEDPWYPGKFYKQGDLGQYASCLKWPPSLI